MQQSNRMTLIERERLHGAIRGVDFGRNLSCIARSPVALLLWSGGSPYWSGRGTTAYGASCLYGWNRALSADRYQRLGKNGGKLTVARLATVISEIETLFEESDLLPWLTEAVRHRQTLLIEGGGSPLQLRHSWNS